MKALEWKTYKNTNYIVSNSGLVKNEKTSRVLKPYSHNGSYKMVNIAGKMRTVHSLVAECFIGDRPYKYTVNHKDGNKLNNNIDNLEYLSYSENVKHAYDNGLASTKNLSLSKRKLSTNQVEEIRLRYKPRCMMNGTRALGREFGVSQMTISQIVRGDRRIKYEEF